MKKVMNKTKIAAIAFMVIFATASVNVFAAAPKDENPTEFKYIGSTNNQPVFVLNMHNSANEEFVITLKSAYGDILYSEKVSGKEIERQYRLTTDEFDNDGITVEVTSKKNNTKVVYGAKKQSHVVEDVVISKL